MERGAQIVIRDWLKLKPWERLLIVTGHDHENEAEVLKKYARKRKAPVDILFVEKEGIQVSTLFDAHETVFDPYQAIIGATDYSLVTTLAVKRAIRKRKKYLSLPLSTNNGQSMLSFDFITMDTKKSKMMARVIMKYLDSSSVLRVRTRLGTNLDFYKKHRTPGFFNGVVKDGRGYSSASIEVYVPIEETKTEGTLMLDGSYGYIGKVENPVRIELFEGRIQTIEDTKSGKVLSDYLRLYHDPEMYVAGELGIGLNSYAKCRGDCYIEDESSYGTFHIGFGRNLALGGKHTASGHFDLITREPDIYADNRQLMDQGKIIVPEPEIY